MEGDRDGDGLSCMSTGESPEKRLDEMEKRVSRKRTVRCLDRGEARHKLKDCMYCSYVPVCQIIYWWYWITEKIKQWGNRE